MLTGEIKVMNHFFKVLRTALRSVLASIWAHGKVARESFHVKAQELKHNLSLNVIFSLLEVWAISPLVRSKLLSSAASGVMIIQEKGRIYIRREIQLLEQGFKTKCNQSHKDP